jgi:hypothetical protein
MQGDNSVKGLLGWVSVLVIIGLVFMYARNSVPAPAAAAAHQKKVATSGSSFGEMFREGAGVGSADMVQPKDDLDMTYKAIDYESTPATTAPNSVDGSVMSCYPKQKLMAEDLLPKEAANTKWAQINPVGTGALQNVNLLTSGYNLGVNTVGSSHKNPNMSLRADPAIPKLDVSPWLNSTIEPDMWRKKLEDY